MPQILMRLAEVLISVQKFEIATRCLNRALEYSFYNKDFRSEIEVYEALGKIFFEQNLIPQSNYFHSR